MESALVKFARRHAADAAGDLVANSDSSNQGTSGHTRVFRKRQSRSHGGAAHVDNRFVVRIVVFERLRKSTVRKRSRGHSYWIAESENAAWTGGRHRYGGIARRFPECSFRAGQRQANDVHHSQLGSVHDVSGKIFESDARSPCSKLTREWQVHGTTVQLSIRDCHVRNENTSLVYRYQPH